MATTVITNYQAIASTIATMGGTSGLQFQATATHLQWKTEDTEWTNLVSLAEIGGTDFSLIEWRVSATHLQWRFDGINWVDVIALSALGVTGGITSLTPEASKIPLAGEDGKIASEWVRGVVTVTTSPGGGNRLLAGNLPADMAQLSNVVVAGGLLQSWTANGIDYVATYSSGKVATVTASDGWVQTYAWAGDVPTITVAKV